MKGYIGKFPPGLRLGLSGLSTRKEVMRLLVRDEHFSPK